MNNNRTRTEAEAAGAVEPLDLRTLEQLTEDEDATFDGLRETLTGLPARPGVIR